MKYLVILFLLAGCATQQSIKETIYCSPEAHDQIYINTLNTDYDAPNYPALEQQLIACAQED